MRRYIFSGLALVLCGMLPGCRNHTKQDIGYETSGDTTRAVTRVDSTIVTEPKSDTVQLPSRPIPDPIATARLAEFLPQLPGYQTGELQEETKVRPNFKSSKVLQTYTTGDKKITVEINDYCNVPFLYDPFAKFMEGDYLNDDNVERTETTTIKGFKAVQTWEKKNNHGNIFVFPGERFVISIIGEGVQNIGELRSVAESINLNSLAVLN
jgi:hypothetical protein